MITSLQKRRNQSNESPTKTNSISSDSTAARHYSTTLSSHPSKIDSPIEQSSKLTPHAAHRKQSKIYLEKEGPRKGLTNKWQWYRTSFCHSARKSRSCFGGSMKNQRKTSVWAHTARSIRARACWASPVPFFSENSDRSNDSKNSPSALPISSSVCVVRAI